MKTTRLMIVFSVLLLVAALFSTGCSDKNNVNGPERIDFESAQFALIDYTDIENAIEDGDSYNAIAFNTSMLNYSFMDGDRPFMPGNGPMRGMGWFDRFDFGKHLGMIFRRLNFTDDQKVAVKELTKNFHDAMKPLVQQFHEANKTIIQDANAKRKVIAEDLKAGTITREQAGAKFKELNDATRKQINENDASKTIKTDMCAERDKLFAGVKAKLVGEQITNWNNYISKIKDPCSL
ncbi:MAG: hypothetical protein V1799_14640 [bacterium]